MAEKAVPSVFKVRPNAPILTESDDSNLYLPFAASVPVVDSDGEYITPDDFDLSCWEINPVWLWAHERKELPIGAGYAPDGTIAAWKTKEMLKLGCRFSQANPAGTMTYALYKEGTLKMVSVGGSWERSRMNMDESRQLGVNFPVVRLKNATLFECSAVPVAANPLATILGKSKKLYEYVDPVGLASVLDKGKLNGEKVPAFMAKSLAPYADQKKKKSSAFNCKLHRSELASSQTGGRVMSQAVVAEKSAPAVAEKSAAAPVADEKAKKDAEVAGEPGNEEVVLPVGATVYRGVAENLHQTLQSAMDMLPQSDNPEIKEKLMGHVKTLAGHMGTMCKEACGYFPEHEKEFKEHAAFAEEHGSADDEAEEAEGEAQAEEEAGGEHEGVDEEHKSLNENIVTKADFGDLFVKSYEEHNVPAAMEEVALSAVDKKYPRLADLENIYDSVIALDQYFQRVKGKTA